LREEQYVLGMLRWKIEVKVDPECRPMFPMLREFTQITFLIVTLLVTSSVLRLL